MEDDATRKAMRAMLRELELIGKRSRELEIKTRLKPNRLGELMRAFRAKTKFYECL